MNVPTLLYAYLLKGKYTIMQITTQTNNNEYADNVHGSTY